MATLPNLLEQASPVPRGPSGIAGYQPVRSDAGASLIQSGRELGIASEILADTNEKQDAIVAQAALNKLREHAMLLERDPKEGFANAKGSAVVDPSFVQSYQDRFKGVASEIESGLTSPRQKEMFRTAMPVTALSFQSGLLNHKSVQTTLFNRQTRDDSIAIGMNDIAAHPFDDNTYKAQSVLIGQAIVADGKDLGLDGDALANYVARRGAVEQSKALAYRTASMLQVDPDKAAKFFHENELDFDPNARLQLGGAIKTALDIRAVKAIGEKAFGSAAPVTGQPLPANVGAPDLKPFDAKQIESISSRANKPSKFDELFKKYGEMFNVSPTELKLRALVESGLNPTVVNNKSGSMGLMQFMPDTAKRFGIDPMNPEQAIAAAASLMAQAGGTLGSDMSKVDRVYYGGNEKASGPNTSQYVENWRALRQAVYGAGRPPDTIAGLESSMGEVVATAKALAQRERPGDPAFEAQAVQEATKNLSQKINVLRGEEYANYSSVLGLSIGPSAVKSASDLPPEAQQQFAKLSPERQHSLFNLWESNSSGAKAATPENTRQYLALMGQAMSDPVAFKNRDIAADIKGLPNHYRSQVLNVYTNIDKEAAKGANYTRVLNDPQVASMIAAAGVKKPVAGKTSEDQNKEYETLTGMVMQSVDAFVEDKKRQPTPREYLSIVAPVLADVKVPGFIFGNLWPDTKKAFQLKPGDKPMMDGPAKPTTAEDFAKLPKGATFINPADGRLMVKN